MRRSKYRNIYCDNPKAEQCYQQIPVSTSAAEHGIRANEKYFAVTVKGGGGPFAVLEHGKPCRYDSNQALVRGHAGAVLGLDWNPFNADLIASGSEDQTVKVWGIPEGGLTQNITDPLVDLQGHARPVTHVRFHPTADNLLASCDKAHAIKLWDISTGGELTTNSECKDLIHDFCWDYTGKQYCTSTKDKAVTIFDARTSAAATTIAGAHGSTKAAKTLFLGDSGKLLTVGFTRSSEREVKIWDPSKPDKALTTMSLGQGTGVAIPVYDPDTKVLYVACKGDTTIKYYEIEDDKIFTLTQFTCPVSAVGIAPVPKRGLDIMSCETARLMRMTNNSVDPLKFIVPRTSQAFQDDIFPDTAAAVPAHTAAEWFGGSDKDPVMMSLNPKDRGNGVQTQAKKEFKKVKSPAELTAELAAANKRIAELEAKLKAAGIEA